MVVMAMVLAMLMVMVLVIVTVHGDTPSWRHNLLETHPVW